ncbi:peptide chain release factor 2 [Coprococcus catus]|uniref:Peptide chain release factor 2 n=3 Tax=Coprococcus TaxID=33042 RepID=A0A3E2TN71_9FIRM|nr:peptide chain release factor 2 [Coprococcus catus]MCM0664286.1 peptide chain release factor 2 [Coprococcus sp. B2-R-112]MCQ5055696.1 peptide chain release factor 2 [Agathobaculum butyriciproducens]MBD8966327.1 peptide chain release factor 2 [Coprococcus catus]MBT9770155.1 peptide chain release factor 2 [Coprococcus catus]MCB6494045.1 peptide chain release factor 2 [Coprococcus catus]
MVEFDQIKFALNGYAVPLKEVGDSLDLAGKKSRIEELERMMEEPGFWDNADKANNSMKELKNLKDTVEEYHRLETAWEDVETLLEMGYEENDASLIPEVQEAMADFEKRFEHLRIKTLLSEEYDGDNAIVTLHAGAGGTEACDWVSMLFRMYTRWAEKHGFTTTVLDYLDGEEAGIKSVTVEIAGENAYGYMKSEKGIHRLVRISPFNAAGKRQTSFASCDVMPDIEEDLDIEINEDDLRIDTYRSSGAGGQHINKTSSAIRITHLPTNIVVQCQNERSQHMNKDKAMQMLKAKLYLLKQQENQEKLSGIRGEVKDNAWGSQIRSYVMQPYKLVKDHRTGAESSNVDAVMDGDIDLFINAYLKWNNLLKNQPQEQ